jgi:diguanylate cyclase (GGDEF)-like protein
MLVDQLVSGYARLLISGVQNWCKEHDANLIVFTGRVLRSPLGHEYQSNVIYAYIRPGTVDALVMASGTQYSYLSPSELRSYVRRFDQIPRVSIGVRLEGVPSVLIDNRSGVRQAMEHLVGSHGLRRIAFLEGPETNEEAVQRREAWREAVADLHLDTDSSLCIRGGDFTQAGARAAMEGRLDRDPRPGFQALLAANDEMAIAASQVLVERGHAIPREIAVVGFDNITTAQFAAPSLTTVDQSLLGQGWAAADAAARLARGEKVSEAIVLPVHLALRTSCGCLPRNVVELESLPTKPGAGSASGARPLPDVPAIAGRCLARWTAAPGSPPAADLVERLVRQSGSEGFLASLHEALSLTAASSVELDAWGSLLASLQRELIDQARTPEEVTLLWSQFQKARLLLSDLQRAEEGRGLTDLRGHLRELRGVMEGLISVASIDELMDDLTPELGRIDMATCLIALYDSEVVHRRTKEWTIPERAEMMLAVVQGRRVREAEKEFSPARALLPESLLPGGRRHMLVATAMYFREEQIGYVLFEPGERDPAIYETFCVLLSNVLKGSRLLQARQQAEERLRQVLAELEEYNQRLSGLSQTDELTGLYNRRAFLSLGSQNLALARRMRRAGTVFFADLDDLKKINDSFGHDEGDHAIQQAARILTETFRHADIVARLGGDEFSVLAVDTASDFTPIVRARLEAALAEYNARAGKPYRVSLSIGSVSFERASEVELEELLRRADQVLYAEKKRRKSAH